MYNIKKEKIFIALILAFLALLNAESAGAQCSAAVSGYDAAAVTMGGVRYRNFGTGTGGRIYLGTNLGVSGGRVENSFSRGITCDGQTPTNSWQASNHVIFSYDPAAGIISSRVTVGAYAYCLEYSVGNLGSGVNYLQFNVINRYAGSTVDFNNVTINGKLVGDFTDSDDATGKNWMVVCSDISSGFVIEGEIVLGGTQPTSSEANKIEIMFGQSADSDGDGLVDALDTCPSTYNPLQHDADADGAGDVCDTTPGCGGCGQPVCEGLADTDGDYVLDIHDNCPTSCNYQQLDADGDGIGDVCDTGFSGCAWGDAACGLPACEEMCTLSTM